MRSVQLNDAHDLGAFDCGVDDLTDWLHKHARSAHSAGTANTFVWTRNGVVVAYYTMSGHVVVRDVLPTKDSRGAPDLIPAYIIGKLALDVSLRGQGRGGPLLWDAIERCVLSARSGPAAKLVVVDAQTEAAKHLYGEHLAPIINSSDSFYIKISTAQKALRSR